jgi:hypothetical protein
VPPLKQQNPLLLMTRFLPKVAGRHVIGLESFRHGNAVFMALVMLEVGPPAKVFGLDRFQGVPATDKALDARRADDFADATLAICACGSPN